MQNNLARVLSICSILGVAGLAAGCAGSSNSQSPLPSVGSSSPAASSLLRAPAALRLVVPDTCGKNTTEPINPAGGTITLPPCGGFTGSLGYPSNNAPGGATLVLRTSITKPKGVPTPSGKTVLLFLQATAHSSTSSITFNSGNATAKLTNKKKLLSSHTYSAYAYAFGFLLKGFPKELGAPTNGSLSFASPVSGVTLPTGITVTFELTQD